MRKPRFGSPKPRKSCQKSLKKNIETNLNIQRFLKHFGPENRHKTINQPKIDKNHVISNFVSILLLPCSSRVVPRCENGLPMCSRDAKMGPHGGSEVPKWLPECQKGGTKAPKWRSCGANLSNLRRGPAAEGVALKIITFS